MESALNIAIWFLFKNRAEEREHEAVNDDYEVYEGITHLKLQKLLYNAQGVFFAIQGVPLFEENIEAWQHGPVIREVYDVYKMYGKNNINITLNEENRRIVERIESDTTVSQILNIVYENFAIYTAWQLRELSHRENGPWDKTMKKGEKIIDNELIRDYFEKEVVTDG